MRLAFNPKFQAFDSNGIPLSGGLLYTYKSGTTTPKATYADVDGSSANTNPVVLDSRGEATLFLQGNYKFILKTSAGVILWTVDDIHGADFHNIAYADDDLEAAVTAAGANETTILVDEPVTLTGNLTVASTIQLMMGRDGLITIPNGYQLTINGPFVCGLFQCFDDENTDLDGVVFGPGAVEKVFPEWWGAAADGTTDDTSAIQAAFRSISSTGGTVAFAPATYCATNIILYTDGGVVIVSGSETTLLKCIAGGENDYFIAPYSYAYNSAAAGYQYHIRNLRVDSNSVASNGIIMQAWFSQLEKVAITGATVAGICLTGKTLDDTELNAELHQMKIINCRIYANYDGIYIDDCTTASINDTHIGRSDIYENTNYGLRDEKASGLIIESSHFWTNTAGDVYIDALYGWCRFNDTVFENYEHYSIFLANALSFLRLQGCFMRGPVYVYQSTSADLCGIMGVGNQFIEDGHYLLGADANIVVHSTGDLFVTSAPYRMTAEGNTCYYMVNDSYSRNVGQGRLIRGYMRGSYTPMRTVEWGTAAPSTSGTYRAGDIIYNTAINDGVVDFWECVTAGTLGTLSGVTGSIDTGTRVLTVNDADDLMIGQFVSIAGVSDTKYISDIDGTTVTINANADATVAGAAVAFVAPTFTARMTKGVRSNAGAPSGALTPNFVGEIVRDTSATPDAMYIAIGTGGTDWAKITP